MFKTGATLLAFTLLLACTRNQNNNIQTKIQGDTLKIITETRGDTIIKTFVSLNNNPYDNHTDTSIYSYKGLDTTIPLSHFYFEAHRFKIYFDTAKTIAYCDSIIKNTPPDEEGTGYVNWSILQSATGLKDFAQSGKQPEYVMVGWLESLLDRFEPLIIDTTTNQKVKRMFIEKFIGGVYGSRSYFAITRKGDTALVGFVQDYWNYEVEPMRDTTAR